MKNENKFTIRKIPLKSFLSLLTDIYNSGADFVDVNGHIDAEKQQDEITISVPINYISPETTEELSAEDLSEFLENMEEAYSEPPLQLLDDTAEVSEEVLLEKYIIKLISNA